MSVNLFCLFALLPIIIVDAKIHSMQRFRRDSNILDVNKSFVAHDMPQPIGFGDLSKVFMDQNELHKRLHRLTAPPAVAQMPAVNFLQHDAPGMRSGPKQPFLFHIAQDFFSAAVNFLFQFMI